MKRLISIVASILVLGGLMMIFSLNGDKQLSKEEQRNREYEVSLVKALKNSYRDLEEIQITNPVYYDHPGSWGCTVELSFLDGQIVEYDMSHRPSLEINRSAVTNGTIAEILSEHFGVTNNLVKTTYSDGKEVME